MNKKLVQFIQRYETRGDFTHADIEEEKIKEGERELGLKLPEEYKEFLRQYGQGGIGGAEIIGVGKNKKLLFVDETLKYRSYGISSKLVVVENCDEWIYCIDCDDATVVEWYDGEETLVFKDFETYLFERFKDAAENL